MHTDKVSISLHNFTHTSFLFSTFTHTGTPQMKQPIVLKCQIHFSNLRADEVHKVVQVTWYGPQNACGLVHITTWYGPQNVYGPVHINTLVHAATSAVHNSGGYTHKGVTFFLYLIHTTREDWHFFFFYSSLHFS